MARFIEERTYYPEGCDPDDWDGRAYQLKVQYRGSGKWAVTGSSAYEQMTHTGKMLFAPEKMNALKWCRFDFNTACALAEKHIDSVTAQGGMTFAEWQNWKKEHANGQD